MADETRAEESAGSSAANAADKWIDEADNLSGEMEKLFRQAFGEVPRASELGDLRALQMMLKNLVRRAAAEGGGGASPELAAVTAERDKLKDAALRAKADFLNYQARAGKDLERAEEQALRKFVNEILPILDNLDLANADASSEDSDPKRVKEALDLTGQSLKQVLAVRGLERIPALGKPYDANLHEAVFKRPANPEADEKPNTCVEELRAGYLWKGLVLRPVQVVVTEAAKK